MFLEYLVLFASLAFVACSEESSSTSAALESPFNPNIEYGELTDSRDGQTYKTVKIGEQVWMAQNLNYEIENSYCYDNNSFYCTMYGRLYTWAAAVGKTEDECGYNKNCDFGPDHVQGICPDGWHIPDTTEWKTLIVTADGSIVEYSSTNVAGQKLKAQTGWRAYSGIINENAYGFSAFPACLKNDYDDHFFCGTEASFWSAQGYVNQAYNMYLQFENDIAHLDGVFKGYGTSVRCLKDYY
jgi:uncharacterized protein (TIGR02145 family)